VDRPDAFDDGNAHYEVRIDGRLSETLLAELEVAEVADLTTGIVVGVRDEAALHGLLRRIENLGLEIVSIQRTDRTTAPAVGLSVTARVPAPQAPTD
jgi:hypothetical protein